MPDPIPDPRLEALLFLLEETPSGELRARAQAWAQVSPDRSGLADEALALAKDLKTLRETVADLRPTPAREAALRRRMRRPKLAWAAGSAAAGILLALSWAALREPPTPRLALMPSGQARPVLQRKGRILDTRADITLKPGDRLSTFSVTRMAGESGELVLGDGAELSWLAGSGDGLTLRLLRGGLFSSLKPASGKLSIQTSAGTVTVTGTEFILDMPPPGSPDRSLFLVVREGSVRLSNACGDVEVPSGRIGYMAPDAAPQASIAPPGFAEASFLWTLTDPQVAQDLASFPDRLAHAHPYHREMAIARLRRFLADLPAQAPNILALRKDPRPHARAGIYRALLDARGQDWEAVAREALSDPDPSVGREVFAACEMTMQHPESLIRFALESGNPVLKRLAVCAIQRRRLPGFEGALEILIEDPDPALSGAALEALSTLRGP